jgi:hypothetical protein
MQQFVEAELYVLVLIAILAVSHIFKQQNILTNSISPLYGIFKNNKIVISILTAMTGILPVPGRILITSAVLDNITTKKAKEFGVLSYLTSHHYYLWSPMEKSVLLCMGGLGLTYGEIISHLWIPILIYLLYTYVYVYRFIDKEKIDLNVSAEVDNSKLVDLGMLIIGIIFVIVIPTILVSGIKTPSMLWVFTTMLIYLWLKYRSPIIPILKSLDVRMIAFVTLIIAATTTIKTYDETFKGILSNQGDLWAGVVLAFLGSFLLGSSSKFAGIVVVCTSIFGIEYFTLFYITDYIAYLLSPSHKCIAIAKMHFHVPLPYFYKSIIILCTLLGAYSVVYLYI